MPLTSVRPRRWNPYPDGQAEEVDVLLDTAAAILEAAEVVEAEEAAGLWDDLEKAQMVRLGVGEARGGSGGGLAELVALVQLAASVAAPIPLVETAMVGGWLLDACDLPWPDGRLAVLGADEPSAVGIEPSGDGLRLSGNGVAPWSRVASALVVIAHADDGRLLAAVVDPAELVVEQRTNLAGEPCDIVRLDGVETRAWAQAPAAIEHDTIRCRGALGRAAQTAGALETILDMTVQHALVREQFGRPIGSFQAIQQQLAVLAGEVAAARAAVHLAVDAVSGASTDAAACVAVAKVRTATAATKAAAIAHQVHGAMGVTHEHPLHRLTSRVLAWRDEYGTRASWSARLGGLVSDQLSPWELITGGAGAVAQDGGGA